MTGTLLGITQRCDLLKDVELSIVKLQDCLKSNYYLVWITNVTEIPGFRDHPTGPNPHQNQSQTTEK